MIDWLERHILSLDKKCEITNSNTTDSIYYTFGDFKIRVSNHLPSNFNSCDVNIVRSLKEILMNLKTENWFIFI